MEGYFNVQQLIYVQFVIILAFILIFMEESISRTQFITYNKEKVKQQQRKNFLQKVIPVSTIKIKIADSQRPNTDQKAQAQTTSSNFAVTFYNDHARADLKQI